MVSPSAMLASHNARMDERAESSSCALPTPVKLHTDCNQVSDTSLPSLLRTDAIAKLFQSHSAALAQSAMSNSNGASSSAFSPVLPQLQQALQSSSSPAPALFHTQQVGSPAPMTDPVSLAIAQLLSMSASASASCMQACSANTQVVMPCHGMIPPANMLASDFYIPHSLLPRDPATQESLMQHRKEKLHRFQEKKRGRGAPSVRYASRKKYADSRPRVKGRFVSKVADEKTDTGE
eukprot:jgi/Ulvmu1/6670/UM030_0001.1